MAGRGAHRAAGGRAGRGALVVLLAVVVLAAGALALYRYAGGASGPTRPVALEIAEGSTATDVGRLLEEQGVIRSAMAFRISAQLPEVAATVESLGLDPQRFERVATSGGYALEPYLPEGTEMLEGFLFPKTYEFGTEGLDEEVVIERLLAQFESEVAGLDWSRTEDHGLTHYETVILASLIEREARVPEDRAKISAVIHNRLAEGMPLQIDASVQYALPEPNRELTFEDYEYESPYNTYLHPGLPPTPIASPGLASLEAALNPADADFLYFVVIDPDTGRHAFAETYEEFLRLREQAGV